ncbi:MAG: hypothetical protein PHN32_07070 [Actinomycetota bacterium]|nr:hypothetical protein [Actinomycetota bacterium]
MQVDTEKVLVKITTDSYMIKGNVHVMPGGRLSDYITVHKNRFIPVTDAEVVPVNCQAQGDSQKREVVFINTDKIEMIEYL